MADINFSANLDTSGFNSALKGMESKAKSAAKSLNLAPVLDASGVISGTAKMIADAHKAEKIFQKAYSIKPTFVSEKSPSASGMSQMAKVPTMGDLGLVAGRSALSGFRDEMNALRAGVAPVGAAIKSAFNSASDIIAKPAAAVGTLTTRIKSSNATTKEFSASLKELNKNAGDAGTGGLPTLRYALYDVANITQRVSSTILTAGTAIVKASMEFETAFTAIERTSLANERRLEVMKSQFSELATQIPLTFQDITSIGAMGAQLGLANSELAGFAKTVAQFSATTNVSIDSAAMSFGALAQLLGGNAANFDLLGSSIAYVGIRSIATETEILSVATAIGGVAAQAGISAEYVIGLSGAMASLRIPAEQSRGALTRIFQEVNRSAGGGVEGMQKFADVMGISAEQALNLAKTDMSAFFSQMVMSMGSLDSQGLTATLDELGLADIRVTNVVARLSQNYDLLQSTLEDSNYGFENGTVLAQLYGNRVEDLAAKVIILQNSFTEFMAQAGDSLTPILGPLVDSISDMLNNLSDALSTDAGKQLSQFAVTAGLVIGIVASLSTGMLLFGAGLAAVRTVLLLMGPSFATATTGAKGFIAMLFGVQTAAAKTATGLNNTKLAVNGFKLALSGIAVIAVIQGLMMLKDAFDQAGQSADIAFKNMISDTSGLAEALKTDAQSYQEAMDSGNLAAQEGFTQVNLAAEAAKGTNEGFTSSVKNMYSALDEAIPKIEGVGAAFENNTRIVGDATRGWITNTLLASESFQALFESTDFTNFISGITDARNAAGEGFSINTLIDMQAAGATKSEMLAYMYELQQIAIANNPEIRPTIIFDKKNNDYKTTGSDVFGGYTFGSKEVNQLVTSVTGLGGAYYLASTAAGSAADASADVGDQFDSTANSADNAAEKIRTVADYASDLSSVWSRAFEIRFDGQQTLDKITSSFASISKNADDARQSIEDVNQSINDINADIQGLTADRALQEYFLTVAEAYGDALNAQKIRANLAKIDSDIADKNSELIKQNKSLTTAQNKTNKTLIGTSDAAIDNRSEITGLVKDYQDHIKALASSGMSQEDLRRKSVTLKAEFMAQATQLGYNQTELGLYANAFDDVTTAIDNVPRNITVGLEISGVNPALAAVNEFLAKARAAAGSGVTVPVRAAVDDAAVARAAQRAQYLAQAEFYNNAASPSNNPNKPYGEYMRNGQLAAVFYGKAASLNYSSGGYTGAGGKYDVAGTVHKGEYVVPKAQVNQATQKPYFMEQTPQYFSGGYVGGSNGSGMVSLSPEDRALLRNVGGSGSIVLYADGKELARSVNDGNRQIVASGGRP